MSKGKRGLGKGLGALIPELEEKQYDRAEIREVEVMRIRPNPYQPRKSFDQEKLKELAESIKEHGVLQPVILTLEEGEQFYLVTGERRWRAAKIAEREYIPAIIREVEPQIMMQVALIENLQREDLNPLEEAYAYRKLIDEFSLTQEELSKRIGRSRSSIANTLRLLSLPQAVQDALSRGVISEGQARPLLSVKDPASQEELAQRVIGGHYSAREVESMVKELLQGRKEEKKAKLKDEKKDDDQDSLFHHELKETLQKRLGTKVKINPQKQGGVIEIAYFSQEDLERVVSIISEGKEKAK